MAGLEGLVRPFQSPGIINDKKLVVTRVTKVATERAIITWGSPGGSPETKQVGIKVTVKGDDVKKSFKEKSRKTTDIKVTNPDNPDNWVQVRRIDEMQMTRPKPFEDKVTGQPTDVPPGNQKGGILYTPSSTGTTTSTTTSSASSSGFADGKDGTTISKTDVSGATTTFVNGNTNVSEVSNAGVAFVAEKRTEEITLKFDWSSDQGIPA